MKPHLILYAALALLLATACSGDEETLTPEAEPQLPAAADVVRIIGNAATSTRSNPNLPAQSGECHADRLLLRYYRSTKTGKTVSFSASDLTIRDATADVKEVATTALNGSWREARNDQIFSFRRTKSILDKDNVHEAFAITGLAFSDDDRDKFSLSAATAGARFDQATLTLPASGDAVETPELFFSPVGLSVNWTDDHKKCNHPHNAGSHGVIYYTIEEKNDNELTRGTTVTGVIYRIVSQLNLVIHKVPVGVKALELLATRVPTQIGLWGGHGGTVVWDEDKSKTQINESDLSYPVAAATASQCTPATAAKSISQLRLSTRDAGEVTATLSSFLLPSEEGMELTLRVTYVGGTQRSFPVQPVSSAVLGNLSNPGADNARNANYSTKSGDPRLAQASPRLLYVYDATHAKFYSYSNVRVTITADFDKVASERTDVDLHIDVEPAFERTHTFEAI